MVLARGSRLMDLPGVGPVVAARILADVGDVARFADRNRFASWTGTAPLDASSGEQVRHRLSRAGNRKINHMLHIAAATQVRLDTPGRGYYRRKLAAGQDPDGSHALPETTDLRCRLPSARRRRPHRRQAGDGTGPGGHCGASQESSAVDLPPHIDTSDQPLPGPAKPTLQPTSHRRKTHQGSSPRIDLLTTEGSRKTTRLPRLAGLWMRVPRSGRGKDPSTSLPCPRATMVMLVAPASGLLMTDRIGRLGPSVRVARCRAPRTLGWRSRGGRVCRGFAQRPPGETGSGAVSCTVGPSADAHASPRSRTRAPRSWTLPLGSKVRTTYPALASACAAYQICSSACTEPLKRTGLTRP